MSVQLKLHIFLVQAIDNSLPPSSGDQLLKHIEIL